MRILGVAEENMELEDDINEWLRRADDMVCRVTPKTDAACWDDRSAVIGGISCFLNGDSRSMWLSMLSVFSPTVCMILLSEGGMFS